MVGREVSSSGVHRRRYIGLVWRLGGDRVICFCLPTRTKGGHNLSVAMHCVGGGCLLYCWKRTMLVAVTEAKREVGKNCEEV